MATSFGHESEFAGLFASWNRQKDKSCLMPNLNFCRSEWVTAEGNTQELMVGKGLGKAGLVPIRAQSLGRAVAGGLRWVEGCMRRVGPCGPRLERPSL